MQFVYSVRHTVPVQSLYGSCTVPASARRIRQAQGRAGKKRKSKGKKRSTKKPGRNRTAGHRSLVSPPPTHPLPASRFLGLLCSPPSFSLFSPLFYFSPLSRFFLSSPSSYSLLLHIIPCPTFPFFPACISPSVPRWSVSHRWAYHRPVPASAEFVASLPLSLHPFPSLFSSPHSLLFICIKESAF